MAQYVYTMNRVGKIVPPKREILKDISLSFFPGAKIGVLGLNGSGKSTLLRIMAGIDKDIEGEANPQAGLKIGYLPQEASIFRGMNVEENIMAVLEIVERNKNKRQEKLEELLELCKKVNADNSLAEELLPSASGFFFGGTGYDEWYFNDINHTIEIIEECLEDASADEFEYNASW